MTSISSAHPTVVYHVMLKNGETIEVDNPAHLPDMTRVEYIEEPMIKANIICANENIGDIMKIVMDKRGSRSYRFNRSSASYAHMHHALE